MCPGAVDSGVDLTGHSSVVVGERTGLKPELEVLNDYDGFFGKYVSALVEQKANSDVPFQSNKIVVSSGPWRPYDVFTELKGHCLHVDFYSLCRWQGVPDTGGEALLNAL